MSDDIFASTELQYRSPFDSSLQVEQIGTLTHSSADADSEALKAELSTVTAEIGALQEILYAEERRSVLFIFQGMDASGKNSTIHTVFTDTDPGGSRVNSFKVPAGEETQHDFLWRCTSHLPRFGELGIFNRSYYEAVLTEFVRPEVLSKPGLSDNMSLSDLMQLRYESIREYERHLHRNGTRIVKFWLNISRDVQAQRLLKRIDKPSKHWKFSSADVTDRDHWDKYMQAYTMAVNATSREWAPWYIIPADDKPMMRLLVARIALHVLRGMNVTYPVKGAAELELMEKLRKKLLDSRSAGTAN